MSSNALILVAAGRGERAGGDVPKQYRLINGRPLIAHTLANLTQSWPFDKIVIVVAEGDPHITPLLSISGIEAVVVTGGASRTASVRAGLSALDPEAIDHVYIHDAARPFASADLLRGLSEGLKEHPAAAPSLPIADALKALDGKAVDRDKIIRVQTPQAFRLKDILAAFERAGPEAAFADDIAAAQTAGLSIAFTQGDERNFKVTYPSDFDKAEQVMTKSNNDTHYIATGSGFDVHRFEAGDSLWLCGVEIPACISLRGHSDADVGLHALTDAILGALADGDIGDHFPPSDPQWAGASSDRFLTFAADKVKVRGGEIYHVDVTLICEKPKVKPHRAAMRARIAELLNLPLNRVSVKATTTEQLGFTGRGEGIAAQASATVKLPA